MPLPDSLELLALPGLPMVREGDDLGALIIAALDRAGRVLAEYDVLVVAQKVVSKAEGRLVDLATVTPSAPARELAVEVGKDPRLVEVILTESVRVVRRRPNLMIMQHQLGFVMANAGVDQSNVAAPDGVQRAQLAAHYSVRCGVIVSDSFGRPWRRGTAGVAIGAAGLPALLDLRGSPDLFGRTLEVSIIGFADEVAAAASLLQGQAGEGRPVVLVRGLSWRAPAGHAADLVRTPDEDLFR
jgi:coenzyme F420-0:L-glutamate ligase / coenzyme F420-1:gamma-L-glutamate ligase